MFTLLLAWSWGGHGQITTAAVGLATAAIIRLGRSGLTTNLIDMASKVFVLRVPEAPSGYKFKDAESAISYLLSDLPGRVQEVDLHVGNIPWGVGEALDHKGQVRHFMRSTEATTSLGAFTQSMDWIRSHLLESWRHMSDAFSKHYKWYNVMSSNAGDFLEGLSPMADALHTAEDSYAQGHATRDVMDPNLIRGLNYWDEENKKGDPGTGRLGHEQYDDPGRAENKPYIDAATVTMGELITCVLSNIDQTEKTFSDDLEKRLKTRFAFSPSAGDFPMPGNARSA